MLGSSSTTWTLSFDEEIVASGGVLADSEVASYQLCDVGLYTLQFASLGCPVGVCCEGVEGSYQTLLDGKHRTINSKCILLNL